MLFRSRWKEAEKLFVQGWGHPSGLCNLDPDTLASMANLASTYRNQGRWAEAEKLFVHVLETSKTILGPEHPQALVCVRNLSRTLKELGRHAEALSMLQACVQLQDQRLGPDHPYTIAALKAWQELVKNSTSRSPFELKYISRTISTVFGALKLKKE